MIKTRIVRDTADTMDLIETYSDANMKLRQNETNKVYGASVQDRIAGYDGETPYAAFTYTETDEPDDSTEEPTVEDYQSSLRELGVEI